MPRRNWVKCRTQRPSAYVAANLAAHLIGSRTVNDPDAPNLTAILLAGSNAPLPVEHAFMPPFARGHSDDELAAVANFVNGFFGNGTVKVTAADIDKARRALP
jgi:mono/diheme cytochrome c family protein